MIAYAIIATAPRQLTGAVVTNALLAGLEARDFGQDFRYTDLTHIAGDAVTNPDLLVAACFVYSAADRDAIAAHPDIEVLSVDEMEVESPANSRDAFNAWKASL